jgi:2-aminoethylphosphonate-pyruvate transaminase
LYDKGFTIYPGKLGKKKTFRLANMGDINSIDIDRFINELSNVIMKIGIDRISYK